MIHDMKPYPAYKDSGVPWLGQVPEHWEVVPNRALLKLKKKLVGSSSANYTLLSLTKQGVIPRDIENPEGKFPASFDMYQEVDPGDLIFCLFDIDETPRAVGLSNLEGMITGAYTVFKCSDPETVRFIYLFYLAMDNGKHLKPLYTGLRKVITKSTFLSAKMPLPTSDEQSAIVRYLDYMDRRIRRYIHSKQKLIKLLEEQKQAIIHRAVTRGLDPNVKLKPSGVEWLGDVPEHWEVKPLKHLSPHITVGIVIQPARLYVENGVPALRSLNISSGKILPNNLVFISEEENLHQGKSQVYEEDIVVVRTGQAGVAAIVTNEFNGTNCIDLLIIRKSEVIISKYLLIYLNSWAARSNVQYCSVGAIQAHYNTSTLANLMVPVPSLAEQKTIYDKLVMEINLIENTSNRANKEITLLKEYRTRLISDIVTGKLDVREAAANLPDEVGEPEVLEDEEITEVDSEGELEENIGED